MTLFQILRGIITTDPHIAALAAARITFPEYTTVAEQVCSEWEGSTVRDPLFREAVTRCAVWVEQSGMGWIWRFQDGSALTANDAGVWVR